jgi:hypothetical protein
LLTISVGGCTGCSRIPLCLPFFLAVFLPLPASVFAAWASSVRVSARAHAGVLVGEAGSIEREELCQLNCALPAAALTPTQSTSRSAPAVACPSIPRPRCCCCCCCCCCWFCSRCLCSHCHCLCCLIYGPFIGSTVRAVGRSRRRCWCWSGATAAASAAAASAAVAVWLPSARLLRLHDVWPHSAGHVG